MTKERISSSRARDQSLNDTWRDNKRHALGQKKETTIGDQRRPWIEESLKIELTCITQ